MLHQVDFKKIGFVTLTYPADFTKDIRKSKAQLKEYRRRFEIAYGKVRAIWRLEYQERGAPHYHIMYFDPPFVSIKDWCTMWDDVIHTPAEERFGNSVDLKLITHRSGQKLIACYVGKYISKVDERRLKDDSTHTGRYWGRWNIVEEDPIEIPLSDREAFSLVSHALSRRPSGALWQPRDPTICTVFGDHMGCRTYSEQILLAARSIEGSA
jgi:hypothetical protein